MPGLLLQALEAAAKWDRIPLASKSDAQGFVWVGMERSCQDKGLCRMAGCLSCLHEGRLYDLPAGGVNANTAAYAALQLRMACAVRGCIKGFDSVQLTRQGSCTGPDADMQSVGDSDPADLHLC